VPYPYVVVDNSNDSIAETLHTLGRFSDFHCVGTALNNEEGVDLVLEKQPLIVFLGINGTKSKSPTSLDLLIRLYQYLDHLPHFVIMADSAQYAYESIKAGAFDYVLRPFQITELSRCIFRIRKTLFEDVIEEGYKKNESLEVPAATVQETAGIEDNTRICIKSYGDYQFISLADVVYLKADNNTTDFHLNTGRKLTAYKTLKHYENNLPAYFYRIHNSYIVNSNFITRISTGKSLCYLNGNDTAVSFSKTYKENIDILIRSISTDYL
jgi:DNA-binding LytR/AlgR family response regulator